MTAASRRCASALALVIASASPSRADEPATPRDAGARYGQALGAVEICIGSTVTDKAKALAASYAGDDLAAFKEQAAKVYDAWLKVKACTRQDDPNQCKVIMDRSCLAAEAEIGASAIAGLVDFPKR